jgi:hypothetical protein
MVVAPSPRGERVGIRGPAGWARPTRFVTTGLDPVVHAEMQQLKPCGKSRPAHLSAWIARSSPAMTTWKFVLAARFFRTRVLPKRFPRTSQTKEGRRSADRRIHPLSAPHARVLPPERATGADAVPAGTARLSALRLRRLPRKLMPRLSPGRASREREGAGVTRTIERAYSDAPRAPVIVPAGRCPSRPGAGLRIPPAGTALAPSVGRHRLTSLR